MSPKIMNILGNYSGRLCYIDRIRESILSEDQMGDHCFSTSLPGLPRW